MNKPTILLSSSALVLLPGFAAAQCPTTLGTSSMLTPAAERGLIQRRTALHKGDTLTILVNESMQGSYSASTTTAKTTSAATDASSLPLVNLFASNILPNILGKQAGTPGRVIQSLLGANSVGGKEANSGSGTAVTTGAFAATISVIVTDVDPNGNLHVEGYRNVRVNKETQKLTLTGTVRADDVTPDNTVQSSQVANADIQGDGKGAVADKTRRSFLDRILGWVF